MMNSSNHVQLLSNHFHLVYTMHEIVSPLLVLSNTYYSYEVELACRNLVIHPGQCFSLSLIMLVRQRK